MQDRIDYLKLVEEMFLQLKPIFSILFTYLTLVYF